MVGMRVIPVLDLKGGQVVRGVGGRRDEYRPVVSRLTPSAAPLDVAQAFRKHFGLEHLYVADLDAIAGASATSDTYAALAADGFRLWVDAGVRQPEDVPALDRAGVEGIVAGLETTADPDTLCRLCQKFGSERVVFSLDLKNGERLGDPDGWGMRDPYRIAEQAIRCGVRQVIVLDLARVGTLGGTGTEDLCARLAKAHPGVNVVAGGGVRDAADLKRLKGLGVWGVLVASALHDGQLTREDVTGL
jgi:phosphoribosylformimino-5-aminoimidazole carboxamide ribotide isomerase